MLNSQKRILGGSSMRLTEEVKRPELTKRKYKAINTCFFNSPGACANKLGQYEDIDESPEHLAKIKRAFEIIKTKKLDVCSFINYFVERNDSYETYVLYFEKPIEIDYCVISEELLTEEEFNLVKEWLEK